MNAEQPTEPTNQFKDQQQRIDFDREMESELAHLLHQLLLLPRLLHQMGDLPTQQHFNSCCSVERRST